MTDDTEVYYNAWCTVMGPPAHRLLCTWHVDRAWRKNLTKIKALMEISDPTDFDRKLKSFLDYAKKDCKTGDFALYFEKEYASRVKLWSFSRRLCLRVHHNMHLEALHRVLKHVHMQGRKVKRMDKSLFALVKLMRRKNYDRIIKIHKGKWTRHLCGIRDRHKRSLVLDNASVHCVVQNKVYCVGVTGPYNAGYLVEANEQLPHSARLCRLHCSDCNICIHYFTCNCLDSGLRNTVCKHVHLVMRSATPDISKIIGKSDDHTDVESVVASQVTPHCELSCYAEAPDHQTEETVPSMEDPMPVQSETAAILGMTGKQQNNKYLKLAEEQLDGIKSEISQHPEIASNIYEELKRVRALCSALKARPQLPALSTDVEHEPSNKLSVKQRQFMSTKQKSKKRTPQLTLSKPTEGEKKFLLDSLDGTMEIISINKNNTDHDYDVCASHVVDFEHSY